MFSVLGSRLKGGCSLKRLTPPGFLILVKARPESSPRKHVPPALLTGACLVLIAALAWAYLFHLSRGMAYAMAHDSMAGMFMAWTASDVFFAFVMWVVMMIAMMAGSAAPMLLLFVRAHQARGQRGALLAGSVFGLGYLAVWTGFSALATLAQWALHQTAMLSSGMAPLSPRLAGAILIGAGAYQWTSLKGACLAHCRSPLGFLLTNWREGTVGALRMGLRHGTYCLGCCWALMCVLFAVGVMNLAWVAVLTAFVFLEKIGPAGALVARTAGAAMMLAGAGFVGFSL